MTSICSDLARRLAFLALVTLSACASVFGVGLDHQRVPAACGMCVFKEEAGGCYWAIEWEGEHYAVNGPTPKDHDAHGPEGMCRMPREAVVTGTIRGDQFFADAFELLPVDPTAPKPDVAPHEHAHGPAYR